MSRKRGRPTLLTDELQNEICKVLRVGNYVETVCDYVGIDKGTYYGWMRRGRDEKERIDESLSKKPLKSEAIYLNFFNAVKKASAQSEIRDVSLIERAAEESWQAAAWRLERKYPTRWGRNRTSDNNEADQLKLEKLKKDIEFLDERIKQLKGDTKDTSLLEQLIKLFKEEQAIKDVTQNE